MAQFTDTTHAFVLVWFERVLHVVMRWDEKGDLIIWVSKFSQQSCPGVPQGKQPAFESLAHSLSGERTNTAICWVQDQSQPQTWESLTDPIQFEVELNLQGNRRFKQPQLNSRVMRQIVRWLFDSQWIFASEVAEAWMKEVRNLANQPA